RLHAETNDVVHVFEHGGKIVGYQFWRTAPLDLPGARVILGGKLRVLPGHRGRALHLRSGLRFFLGCKARHPFTRYYRLSVVSLFGFVSLTSALAEYRILDPHPAPGDREGEAIRAPASSPRATTGWIRRPVSSSSTSGLLPRRSPSFRRGISTDRRPAPTPGSIPAGGKTAPTSGSGSGSPHGTWSRCCGRSGGSG